MSNKYKNKEIVIERRTNLLNHKREVLERMKQTENIYTEYNFLKIKDDIRKLKVEIKKLEDL